CEHILSRLFLQGGRHFLLSIDSILFSNQKRLLPMKKKQRKYRELNLSDSFMKSAFTGQAALECRALMLNINLGHNQELLESCKVLWEYSYFINEVRENQKQGLAIETAVQEAQKSCIKKDILKEFLEQNSAEVSDVILE